MSMNTMSMNGSHAGPPQPFGPPIPGDRSTMFTAFAAVCLFFVAVAVGLRMARCRMNHIFRPDDHLILFCGVLALVTTTLDCVGGYYGAGRHLSNIPLENLHYATKLPLIAGCFLTITLALTKLSVALTLLRINISKLYVIIIAITATVAVLGNIQLAIIIPLGCASARQDPNASSYCISKHGIAIVSYLQATVNIVTDVAFVLTPMIGLRSIKLARKDKIATNILLAFIFTATIVSIAKLATLPTFIRQSSDITWANIPVNMYGIGEATLCIVAACLPAIRQFISAYFPTWRLQSNSKSNYSLSNHTAHVDHPTDRRVTVVGTTHLADPDHKQSIQVNRDVHDEEKGMGKVGVSADEASNYSDSRT